MKLIARYELEFYLPVSCWDCPFSDTYVHGDECICTATYPNDTVFDKSLMKDHDHAPECCPLQVIQVPDDHPVHARKSWDKSYYKRYAKQIEIGRLVSEF